MIPRITHLVASGVRQDVAEKWIESFRDACIKFQIDTPSRIAAFAAQCAHESAGFTALSENLNYSADSMAAVWPNRFAEKAADGTFVLVDGKKKPNKFALTLHRRPETLACVVYANRMGNGSIEGGDGWRFRGRGLKQLTGKDNYMRCGNALGVDLVSNPDLLTTPKYAALSAGWFWATNNLSSFADSGDLEGMTKKINGGLIGYPDRKARYSKVLAAIVASPVETSALA